MLNWKGRLLLGLLKTRVGRTLLGNKVIRYINNVLDIDIEIGSNVIYNNITSRNYLKSKLLNIYSKDDIEKYIGFKIKLRW